MKKEELQELEPCPRCKELLAQEFDFRYNHSHAGCTCGCGCQSVCARNLPIGSRVVVKITPSE